MTRWPCKNAEVILTHDCYRTIPDVTLQYLALFRSHLPLILGYTSTYVCVRMVSAQVTVTRRLPGFQWRVLTTKRRRSGGLCGKQACCKDGNSKRLRLTLISLFLSQLLLCTSAVDVNAVEYLHDSQDDERLPAFSQLE